MMEVEDQREDGVTTVALGSVVDGSATVFGTIPDGESAVIGQQQWEVIRERHGAGDSVSGIARELGLDRKTVRRCLRAQSWRPYRRKVSVSTLLEPHRAWLLERAPAVRFSARNPTSANSCR
jgi:hypothetical protein